MDKQKRRARWICSTIRRNQVIDGILTLPLPFSVLLLQLSDIRHGGPSIGSRNRIDDDASSVLGTANDVEVARIVVTQSKPLCFDCGFDLCLRLCGLRLQLQKPSRRERCCHTHYFVLSLRSLFTYHFYYKKYGRGGKIGKQRLYFFFFFFF